MPHYEGKRVSRRWRRALTAAREANIAFVLTSGRRTLAEQWTLFRQNMVWNGWRYVARPGHPVTAYPTPNAPHIWAGRQAHALDVNSLDGGETRLQRWLEGQGATVTNPVLGETWHMVVSGADLRRLSRKIRRRRRLLRELPTRSVSRKGIRLVAEFEGGQSPDGLFHPYRDPVGVWTIGYGHTKGVGPSTGPWTKATAEHVLRYELNEDYAAPVRALNVPLNQPQFDALCSFVFNLGPNAISNATGIGRALRVREWQRAADEMLRWNRAGGRVLPGLTRRREAERNLFLSGREA